MGTNPLKSKMRILMSADPMLPVPPRHYGGIERVIASLIGEYRKRGHEVALVGHPDSSAACESFYAWSRASPGGFISNLTSAWMLRSAVSDFQPDVIHSFSRLMWLFSLLTAAQPRIMSYQRDPTGRTIKWSRRLHRGRLSFTGCSKHIAVLGETRGGGNWHTIPNFIDPTVFEFKPSVAANAPLVFLSRVERIKGAHNAISIARESGRRLIIAGNQDPSPAGTKYWQEEIEPHLNRDGIEYVGPVDDAQKNALLGAAAAMVVPIEWDEPFGIVFAESLACGTPVISSRRGSLPEIIREGITGILLDSPAEGAAAVARLGELDRHVCRQDAESRFSVGTVASQYLRLYSGLIPK